MMRLSPSFFIFAAVLCALVNAQLPCSSSSDCGLDMYCRKPTKEGEAMVCLPARRCCYYNDAVEEEFPCSSSSECGFDMYCRKPTKEGEAMVCSPAHLCCYNNDAVEEECPNIQACVCNGQAGYQLNSTIGLFENFELSRWVANDILECCTECYAQEECQFFVAGPEFDQWDCTTYSAALEDMLPEDEGDELAWMNVCNDCIFGAPAAGCYPLDSAAGYLNLEPADNTKCKTAATNANAPHGEACEVKCVEGYESVGERTTLTCDNGAWLGVECVEAWEPVPQCTSTSDCGPDMYCQKAVKEGEANYCLQAKLCCYLNDAVEVECPLACECTGVVSYKLTSTIATMAADIALNTSVVTNLFGCCDMCTAEEECRFFEGIPTGTGSEYNWSCTTYPAALEDMLPEDEDDGFAGSTVCEDCIFGARDAPSPPVTGAAAAYAPRAAFAIAAAAALASAAATA